MSDTPDASQTSNLTVPKERLDEVLATKRSLESQLQFTQSQLTHVMSQMNRPQVAPVVDPEMEKLKEENPVLYNRLKKAEQDNRQTRAAIFGMAEEQDKLKYLQAFGEKGQKMLPQVEQILEQERSKGNFNVNRGFILHHLLGQEKLREEMAPKAPRQEAPVTTQTKPADDAPAQDPKQVGATRPGTAGADFSKLSREDRYKQLQDVEF